ncbi:winged helix-turn-helix transcriptional regulator [Natrinema sp. H-ect4]|uniref:winged helix-turn-helix transcriptional regulator n=1 Tax=Natrinema sp. H-ect4 TaxID=3242699 RepID=UPI0035A81D6C
MESDSPVAVRIFACLVAAMLLGGAVTGAVAGAASVGSVATASTDSLETTDDGTTNSTENTSEELESTTESLENTTENTTDDTENATKNTTDSLEESTNETTDGLENTTTDPADTVENTTGETTETVTDTVSSTTEPVNNTTTIANETATNTTAAVNETVSETTAAINETVGETAETTTGTVAGIGGRLEHAIDGAAAPVDPPSTSEAATNAILVGMLGAISASGVAASGAGGAAGAGASGAAGGASTATASWLRHLRETDQLRRAAADLWKILPLFRYSRYDDSDPLEHDCRAAIYETVRKQPGAYLSAVSDRTEVPLSTVRHHVRVLEDEGLVTARKVNGKRRYFLEDDDAELLAALAEPAKREVLETIAEFGRAPNGRLADALERDPSTVSHHLAALEDAGLVVREKDGRSMVNELPPGVEAALADERAAETDSRAVPADD